MLVPVFFVCACLLTTGHVQAEVSPAEAKKRAAEAKKRAALKHYEKKLEEQNKKTVQPIPTSAPQSIEAPKKAVGLVV